MKLQQTGTSRTTCAYDGTGLRRRFVTSGGTTSCLRDGELMQAARVSPLALPSLMGYQETMIASALSAEGRTTYVYDDKGQVVTVIYPKPEAVLLLTKPLKYQGRCGGVARHEAPTSVSIPGRHDYAYSDREGGPRRSPFTDSNHRRVMIYDTNASAEGKGFQFATTRQRIKPESASVRPPVC